MIYRIYPKKDATIYEDTIRKNQNTGKDEILEVGKFYDLDDSSLIGNSRVLLEFDLTEISSSIVSGDISGSIQYYLNLEVTQEDEIETDYRLLVYPIRESWNEGVGKESDTPHNTNSVTWVSRENSSIWDVVNESVNTLLDPQSVSGLIDANFFVMGIGNFRLDTSQSIIGTNGVAPSLTNVNGRLQFLASNFGGGTAVVTASLDAGFNYYINFEVDTNTLSGIDFRIASSSVYVTNISNYTQSITTASTQSVNFTAVTSGDYEISFTFFDRDGSNGSTGFLDNFYIYAEQPQGTFINDTFAISGVSSVYFLNEIITGSAGELPIIFTSQSRLFLSSSNFGGATANRNFYLVKNVGYTSSFDLNFGSGFSNLTFEVLEPDGRVEYSEIITTSGDYTSSFVTDQSGEYSFRWSFYSSGSLQSSASLDSFKLTTDFSIFPTASVDLDIRYEARFNKNSGGCTWYTSSFSSGEHYYQDFDKYTQNLNVEVTDYVNDWLENKRANNGFIILRPKEDEGDDIRYGSIKFFSSDTHTIYVPTLEVKWDNVLFTTGSLPPQTNSDLILYMKDFQNEYKENSKSKIRVFGRERYPSRTFSNASPIKSVNYLPTTTYYSVVDADTNKVFIPFDDTYTKLSCDSTSNYFNFWFDGLQPERYYKFVFKIEDNTNGTTKFYDDNFFFKVIR